MKKLIAALTISALSFTFCTVALAQIPGFNRGGSSPSASTDLMESFIESNKHNLEALIHFATAFDLKDQVELLKAEKLALESGLIDQTTIEKTRLSTKDARDAFETRIADQPELTAEGRESYQKGLVSYFLAIATARDVVSAGSNFERPSLSNPLGAAKNAKSSAYVIREAPGYLKGLQSGAAMLLTYAKSNNIEVPDNATSLL